VSVRPGGRYAAVPLTSVACHRHCSRRSPEVRRALAKAGPTDSAVDRAPLDAFLDRLGTSLEPYYGFRSLQAFKSKFQPRHEPMYLVFPDEAALPRIGVALGRPYLPDAGLRDLLALARSPSPPRRAAS
jgi:hypothetical protein